MTSHVSYAVKIKTDFNLKETVRVYREAVGFFLDVAMKEWDLLFLEDTSKKKINLMERFTIKTNKNPDPIYDFSEKFYKFPCYLRRAAIAEAVGMVSSYMSNKKNWEEFDPKTRKSCPGLPKVGYSYPALYKDNMFIRTGTYTAKIKVFIRNTWDWIDVSLKKSDVDYIIRHCSDFKECVPVLHKRCKSWYLDFAFETKAKLNNTKIFDQKILAVDLGINNACTCVVMTSKGAVLERRFLRLSRENDSLTHALGKVKRAQCLHARRKPRLWARVNGINADITSKTAKFIMDLATEHHVDVIVFEHLNLCQKKNGRKGKRQRLHLWRAKSVQRIVTERAHLRGIRISRINANGTSRYAFDGSGKVLRGREAGFSSYSLCRFPNGKVYNCDLNAAYNIGARYFIREILKTLKESITTEQEVLAKVPELSHRSTCVLSSLISLNEVIAA